VNSSGSFKRDPYIWVTWLTPFLAGESYCQWALWFQANYKFEKLESNFNSDEWRIKHARLVNARVDELQDEGYSVYVENENSFTITGKNRITKVAGKPDIVADDGNEIIVEDCKTGKHKLSDIMQVLIYMLLLPLPGGAPHCKERKLNGRLVYNNTKMDIDSDHFNEDFKADFRKFVDIASNSSAPKKTPSFKECRYCKIPKTFCPDRIDEEPPEDLGDHDAF